VAADLPTDVLQVVHLSPELTAHAVGSPQVNFISFTGSVVGGAAVEKAAVSAPGFKGVALEACLLYAPMKSLDLNGCSLS